MKELKKKARQQTRDLVSEVSAKLGAHLQQQLNKSIDRPNKFTQKTIYAGKARNYSGLRAISNVFIKDIQAAYLRHDLDGGVRKQTLIAVPKRRDQYGNLKGKRNISKRENVYEFKGNKPNTSYLATVTKRHKVNVIAVKKDVLHKQAFNFDRAAMQYLNKYKIKLKL